MDNKKIRIKTISIEKIKVRVESRRPPSNVTGRTFHKSDMNDEKRSTQDEKIYTTLSSIVSSGNKNT